VKNPEAYTPDAIKAILPHRAPFLFVDCVVELERHIRIVAERDLSTDDPFFAGHFPGEPLMPGVLVAEALAQTSGLLIGLSSGQERDFVLASVNIKFFTPARPGDTLRMESRHVKQFGTLIQFAVTAFVGDTIIARGTLALGDRKHTDKQVSP